MNRSREPAAHPQTDPWERPLPRPSPAPGALLAIRGPSRLVSSVTVVTRCLPVCLFSPPDEATLAEGSTSRPASQIHYNFKDLISKYSQGPGCWTSGRQHAISGDTVQHRIVLEFVFFFFFCHVCDAESLGEEMHLKMSLVPGKVTQLFQGQCLWHTANLVSVSLWNIQTESGINHHVGRGLLQCLPMLPMCL